MTDVADYIVHYRRKVPAGLCDRIVKATESSNLWATAQVGQGVTSPARKCTVVNLRDWPSLDAEFFTFVAEIISGYRAKFPYADVSHDIGYNVLRYGVSDYYKEHVDSFDRNFRVLSCSVVLNDDYEGGEFAFFGGEKVYDLQKGDALVFPSNFLYPHQVMPVTAGTRYSIVTWLL